MDLTKKERGGALCTAAGLSIATYGTWGTSGMYAAMIFLGVGLIGLGAGFLGFSSLRSGSSTGTRT